MTQKQLESQGFAWIHLHSAPYDYDSKNSLNHKGSPGYTYILHPMTMTQKQLESQGFAWIHLHPAPYDYDSKTA